MKQNIIPWLFFLLLLPCSLFSQSQNCGLEDRWTIRHNRGTQEFTIEVSGYNNNLLSNTNQGLCRVELGIVHNAFKDLEIWLLSPDGQEIQLIGPNVDGSVATVLANWNISFIRSRETAAPHPGFAERWTNDQNVSFAITGKGTFYPFSGDLENFNTGQVNGTWRVRVRTDPSATNINSFIYHFRLVFCDETGTACCFANAGVLRNIVTDTILCPGDPYLDLQPVPSYVLSIQPDTTKYGYTYVISENGVIQSLADNPDLRTYPPGNYQICGLSYLLADQARLGLIQPGVQTLDSLRRNLDSNVPSFCGKLTQQCVSLKIVEPQAVAAVPDSLTCSRTEVLLDGGASTPAGMLSYEWRDASGASLGKSATQRVNAIGNYQLIVAMAGGCSDTAIVEVKNNLITPVVDAGQPDTLTCSVTQLQVGGSNTSTGSAYRYSWSSATGSFRSSTDNAVAVVDRSGLYKLIVTDTRNGCRDSAEVNIALDTIAPLANAGAPGTLTCTQTSLRLDGSASSRGASYTYRWYPVSGGAPLTDETTLTPLINREGTYELLVSDLRNGCRDSARVNVGSDVRKPRVSIDSPRLLDCGRRQVTLNATASDQGPDFSFVWNASMGGRLEGGASTLQPVAAATGRYELVITRLSNGCRDSAFVQVRDTVPPLVAAIQLNGRITCRQLSLPLDGSRSSTGPGIEYLWSTNDGRLIGDVNRITATVGEPGTYRLLVRDTFTRCSSSTSITVLADTTAPVADAGPERQLNCAVSQVVLNGSNSGSGPDIALKWSGPCLLTDSTQPVVEVNCTGLFYLTLTNNRNGCQSVDSVAVRQDSSGPNATLPDTASINCSTGSVRLDGSRSTGGVLSWWRDNRLLAQSSTRLDVREPGLYRLIVTDAALGCADTAEVNVKLDCRPSAVISAPDTINCSREIIVLDANASSAGGPFTYEWLEPAAGCIIDGDDGLQPRVNCGGVYRLVVTNTVVGQSDTALVTVSVDTLAPLAVIGAVDTLTCSNPSISLNGTGSSAGPGFRYGWSSLSGDELGSSPAITVTRPGTYLLEVVNLRNGCRDVEFAEVERDGSLPVIRFGDNILPCQQDTLRLSATVNPPGVPFTYSWAGPGISGGAGQPAVLVNTPGRYTLTVTNPLNGCIAADSILVEKQACGPCIEILPPDTLTCALDTMRLEARTCDVCTGCSIVWSTADGQILEGGNTLQPLIAAPGTYQIEVMDSAGFTTRLDIVVQADRTVPVAVAGPDRNLTCTVTELRLGLTDSSGRRSYRWRRQDGAPLPGDDQPQLAVREPGVFVLEVRDIQTGCIARDTAVIGIDTVAPAAEAGQLMELTCNSQVATLDGSRSSIGNTFTYQWRAGTGGNILTGSDALNPVVDRPGTYYLTVGSRQNGCSASDSVTVALSTDPPVLPDLAGGTLTCARPTLRLQGLPGNTAGFSFRWCRLNAAGVPVSCVDSVQLTASVPGQYRFELTDQRTGCRNSRTVTVGSEQALPQVDAGQDQRLGCGSNGVRLAGSGGPGPVSIQWSGPAGVFIDGAATLTPTVFAPGKYFLNITLNANGCQATDSVTVSRDDSAPTVSISPPGLLTCLQKEIRLEASASTAGGKILYSWSTPDGRIVNGVNSRNPLVDRPGRYDLIVTDPDNGCSSAMMVLVDEQSTPPQAEIDTSGLLAITCIQRLVTLDGSLSRLPAGGGTLTFNWTVISGTSVIGNPTDPVVQVNRPGSYQLVVTETVNGCRDTMMVNVRRETAPPDVVIAPPGQLTCEKAQLTLNGAASSGGPDFFYTWFDEAGNVLNQGSPTLDVRRGGDYRLHIVNRRTGCDNSASALVEVDTAGPVARIASVPPLDCDRRTVTLDGSASSSGGDFSYRWLTPGGSTITGANNRIATVDAPGQYTLVVSNDRNGCRAVATASVIERSAPVTGASVEVSPPFCDSDGTGIIRISGVQGGTPPFMYALGDDLFSSRTIYTQVLPGDYSVRVQDSNGCEWESNVTVPEPPVVDVDLGADLVIALGDSVRLRAELSGENYDRLIWSPASAFSVQGKPEQVVRPMETTTYSVLVESQGCRALDHITVTVTKVRSFYAPTAFSPDGDGVNDRFTLFAGADVRQIRSLLIVDRWGNLVYRSGAFLPNDMTAGWDGTLDGQLLNPAVFVFYAEIEYVDGWIEKKKGDVALVR